MRISQALKDRVVELDRRYRSTWDAHAIAHVVGMSPTTAAKILREVRGPRPKRAKRPHTRRTRFARRDAMWSTDFVDLGWGWKLIKTIDEMSGFRLGWDLCRSETAEAAVSHARSIVERMGRAPLVWKYDHGSGCTSLAFQAFLAGHKVVAYPIPPRAPWANGRVERDHQDILAWLIPLEGQELTREELEREVDEAMLGFNFVKPRASHRFRKSAEVYFDDEIGGLENTDDEVRGHFAQDIDDATLELGGDPGGSSERLHRRAVRLVMQRWGLYEEWDTAAPEGSSGAETVNRTGAENVSF